MDSNEVVENLDLSKLKVPELKKELKARGLSTTGNKVELIERLSKAEKMKSDDATSAESVEDLNESLLDDDDDEHIDENESVLNDLDSPVESVTVQKDLKRKSSELMEAPKQTKKVVLNRKISSDVENGNVEEKPPESVVEETASEKKVIKLSELSAKERLEMRAKKFGTPLTIDAKKVARAERFGGNTGNKISAISANVTSSVDVLKQRAERFGVKVSTTLTKLENQEKLEKRKERFGAANGNALTQNQKAQQRLEKFKEPVK